jgi:hypothetical protein
VLGPDVVGLGPPACPRRGPGEDRLGVSVWTWALSTSSVTITTTESPSAAAPPARRQGPVARPRTRTRCSTRSPAPPPPRPRRWGAGVGEEARRTAWGDRLPSIRHTTPSSAWTKPEPASTPAAWWWEQLGRTRQQPCFQRGLMRPAVGRCSAARSAQAAASRHTVRMVPSTGWSSAWASRSAPWWSVAATPRAPARARSQGLGEAPRKCENSIPSCRDQRRPPQLRRAPSRRARDGRRGDSPFRDRPEGQGEIGAGIAIGDWEDVDSVALRGAWTRSAAARSERRRRPPSDRRAAATAGPYPVHRHPHCGRTSMQRMGTRRHSSRIGWGDRSALFDVEASSALNVGGVTDRTSAPPRRLSRGRRVTSASCDASASAVACSTACRLASVAASRAMRLLASVAGCCPWAEIVAGARPAPSLPPRTCRDRGRRHAGSLRSWQTIPEVTA